MITTNPRRDVRLRLLVDPDELAEWNCIMEAQHYLKNARLVGEQWRSVAEVGATDRR